jgi:hypothetical protein
MMNEREKITCTGRVTQGFRFLFDSVLLFFPSRFLGDVVERGGYL